MNEAALIPVVMGFGVMITALSAWGVISPDRLIKEVLQIWEKPWSLWLAVVVRLVLGLVMLAVAEDTRYPTAFILLGWLAIAVAALLPVVGKARLSKFMEWLVSQPRWMMSAWCLLGVAFGIFILWSVA